MTVKSDIIDIIEKHPGIGTAAIAEKMQSLGYYSQHTESAASNELAKMCGKIRTEGLITAQCVGGKNYWWPATEAEPVVSDPEKPKPLAAKPPKIAKPEPEPTEREPIKQQIVDLIQSAKRETADDLQSYQDGYKAGFAAAQKPRQISLPEILEVLEDRELDALSLLTGIVWAQTGSV
jgi:hypothetical protein